MSSNGYGAYETYDGIDVSSDESGNAVVRKPLGGFTEPLPPSGTPAPAPVPTPIKNPITPIPCPTALAVHSVGTDIQPKIICGI
jgi:hypothetical protein